MPNLFITSVVFIAIAVVIFIVWKINGYSKHTQKNNEGTPFKRNIETVKQLDLKLEELEVLDHMSEGYSNQEIADKTSMSLNTVNNRVRGIFSKLGVNRRSIAIKKARSLELIP
jgi:DNA-binding NarL/FixJ family response regulator